MISILYFPQQPKLRGSALLSLTILLGWVLITTSSFTLTQTRSIAVQQKTKRQQELKSKLNLFPSFPTLPSLSTDDNGNGNDSSNNSNSIPFVIDRLSDRPPRGMFADISKMCIAVFFEEYRNKDTNDVSSPWKSLQLGYLQQLQESDLRQRKQFGQQVNDMFVARRVVSAPPSTTQPLILDRSSIYNLRGLDSRTMKINNNNKNNRDATAATEYTRGEILGFCEVTEKSFGVVGTDTIASSAQPPPEEEQEHDKQTEQEQQLRPVLTNLSVKEEARKSGVGTKLVEACEKAVVSWGNSNVDTEDDAQQKKRSSNPANEIILEVEDDNVTALKFYSKRGYRQEFADPASRRYNVNGIFLKKVRCTKICMRKNLGSQQQQAKQGERFFFAEASSNFFMKLKENIME